MAVIDSDTTPKKVPGTENSPTAEHPTASYSAFKLAPTSCTKNEAGKTVTRKRTGFKQSRRCY